MPAYSAARTDRTVYVRVSGLANMKNTPILDVFLHTEMSSGIERVIIDLSDCTGMDSTFMGTLVGYADTCEDCSGELMVVNPGAENLKLLEMLGLTKVMRVVSGATAVPDMQFTDLGDGIEQTLQDRLEMIRKAHESLMSLSEENSRKFAPFIKALQADLDKREP